MSGDPVSVSALVRLCHRGRIYAVEEWIRLGKPLVTPKRPRDPSWRRENALSVAIDTRQHDLALLLLCNGFPPDSEDESLLERAVTAKAFDSVELLLAWGADPHRVAPEIILSTYDQPLYDRFSSIGVDLTERHALAYELSRHSSNRAAYGWARRHKDDPRIARELAIGLAEAVFEARERAVALLVWAGADPHARVPTIEWSLRGDEDEEEWTSPITWAVLRGHGRLLRVLKPDPDLDNFEDLWSLACDAEAVDYLAGHSLPADWSPTVIRNLDRILWSRGDSRAQQCLDKISQAYQARLTTISDRQLGNLRRAILRAHEYDSAWRWVLGWMRRPQHCEPAIYTRLTRTPAMQTKLREL